MSNKDSSGVQKSFKQAIAQKCIICGNKVFKNQDFIAASEGYCHQRCVF